MKKYTILVSLFLFGINLSFGQGLETFNNSNATTGYTDNNFVGDSGVTWTYVHSRDENGDANGSGIAGNALMLRRLSNSSNVISSAVANGIGDFSVKLYKGFTSAGNRQVELFVNGVSKGTSTPFNDFLEHTFSVIGINVSGSVTIELRNITNRQVIVDEITWSAYSTSPTIAATPISLTGFTYVESSGGPSAEQSFDVEGSNLTNDIIVNAPLNFEISTTSGAGFGTSITLPHASGTVALTPIFVRQIAGLLAINSPFLENINCTSIGATTVNVAVEGTVTLAPPCNVVASNFTLFQNFDGIFSTLPYSSTNTTFSTGFGISPLAPKFVSFARGIQVNNNLNGEILFDTVDASFFSNINFSIRLASFSGNPFNGADAGDFVRVFISADGGSTYSEELSVSGNTNARWSFGGGTGIANTAYDGDNTPNHFQPASGGIRTIDGYSTLVISNLPVSSQLKVKIEINNNNNNEFWVFDDATLSGDFIDSTVWNGATWSGAGPSGTRRAIIDGIYDTTAILVPSISACDCVVTTNGTLTIAAGKYLEVGNDIINEGNVLVRHEGSIVQYNDDSRVIGESFIIEKITTPYLMYDYTYWSSPTEDADLGTVFATNPSDRIYDFTTANFDDTNGDTFDDNNDDWNVVSGMMTPAKGYIAMGEGAIFPVPGILPITSSSQTILFQGKINNGVINSPVTLDANPGDAFNNQNLIGNPYPSAIDATKLLATNLSMAGTLYFWTHNTQISSSTAGPDTYNFTNNDYMTYTAGLGFVAGSCSGCVVPADDLIASGQGFFSDISVAGNVKFNNAMRVPTGNDNFFKSTPENGERDRIWINMTNEDGLFRQILIGFFDDATDGHDRLYDGKRLESGDNFDFYSLMNDANYAIQGFQTITNEKIVPIGINAPLTGSLQIKIDRFEADLENINVYLRDNLLNNTHDLKIADYNFDTTQEGVFNERFELIFSRNALATNNNEIISNSELVVSNLNDEIHFEMLNGDTITKIQAFDVIGKLVLQANPNTNNININTNINNGTVLFIKVQLENGQILTKKFIKL